MQKIIDIVNDKLLFVDDITSNCHYLFYSYNFNSQKIKLLSKFIKDEECIYEGCFAYCTDLYNKFVYLNNQIIFFTERKLIIFDIKTKKFSSKIFPDYINKIKLFDEIIVVFLGINKIALYDKNLNSLFEYSKKTEHSKNNKNKEINHYYIIDALISENFIYLQFIQKHIKNSLSLDEIFNPTITYILYKLTIPDKRIICSFSSNKEYKKIFKYNNYVFLSSEDDTSILDENLNLIKTIDIKIKHLESFNDKLYILSYKDNNEFYFGEFDINEFKYKNLQTVQYSKFKIKDDNTVIFEKDNEILIKQNNKEILLKPPFEKPFMDCFMENIKSIILRLISYIFRPFQKLIQNVF